MVNVCKKLFYITFKCPHGLCVIFADSPIILPKLFYGFMRALTQSTRIRIRYKCSVKKWIQFSIYRAMKQAVANFCLMNIPWFRVGDVKSVIRAMPIGFLFKLVMQKKNIVHKSQLKLLDIFFLSFAFYKFLPRAEQIFYRNDIVISMSELNHPLNSTPPRALLPVLQSLKNAYILWQNYFVHLPKVSKYSLGEKIDRLLIEAIEASATAIFLSKQEKTPYVRLAVRKLDTIKILLMIAWEIKAIDDKKYIALSKELDSTGKMLGGWHNQLIKASEISYHSRG